MSTTSLDFKGLLKAFPYIPANPSSSTTLTMPVAPPVVIKPVVVPTTEDLAAAALAAAEAATAAVTEPAVGSDQWMPYSLKIPGFNSDLITKALNKLNTIIAALEKVLSVIGLFINSFSSFSRLLLSVINIAEAKVDKLLAEGLTSGVYLNVVAPPAFLSSKSGDPDAPHEAYGGFQGFISRLNTSLYNPDKHKPPFVEGDYVGGCVMVLDSTSLDTIWTELKHMAGMFSFMKLFGFNLEPPAPTNLNGQCGFFEDSKGKQSYGVKIQWDNTYITSSYKISRSRIPGGTKQFVEFFPTYLVDDQETGEPGLLTVVKAWFANIFAPRDTSVTKEILEEDAKLLGESFIVGAPLPYPEKLETVYKDPDFNKGNPKVINNALGPTIEYIDTDFVLNSNGQPTINGEVVTQIYYVVQSCLPGGRLSGPFSKELVVTIKACNDAYATTDVIAHPYGRWELLSISDGHVKINTWQSIQIQALIPWAAEIVDLYHQLLDSLKGMVTNASDAFNAFLVQIKEKIQMYIDMVNVLTYMINMLQNFTLGPSVSFLNLKPMSGGMPVFVERIQNAKLPPGSPPFSGPNGITIGFVFVYGSSIGKSAVAAMVAAFDFITSVFSKK